MAPGPTHFSLLAMATGEQPRPRGGYDCSLVIPSTKYECPVCLLLLRGPHLVSCCGHHLCASCVEQIQKGGKACPLCNSASFNTMHNKGLERDMLNELMVLCTYKDRGCDWSGVLGSLEQHTDPIMGDCPYTLVQCTWRCGETIERCFLMEHEEKFCPNRPWYVCFEDCNLRKFAEKFEVVASENTKLRREIAVLSAKLETACTSNRSLQEDVEVLKSQQRAGSQERADLMSKLNSITTCIDVLKQELRELKSVPREQILPEDSGEPDEPVAIPTDEEAFIASEVEVAVVPFRFEIDKFTKKKKHSVEWYSPPFYTHERGYKMCVRIDPNGIMNGKGTHVSAYVYLMRGEYDEDLKWPFKGVVVLRLLNQLHDRGHHEKTVDFLDSVEDCTCNRVTIGNKSMRGQGFSQFIAHISLKLDEAQNQLYLKDDCLKFEVAGVELKTPQSTPKFSLMKWLSK